MIRHREVDVTKVLAEVEKHNTVARIYVEVYTAMIDVLRQFDGKVINKRLETALKKDPRLEGYHIHYEIKAGMYHINFWGRDLAYENRNHLFLGYVGTNDILNLDFLLEQNRGFLMSKIIDINLVPDKVARWNSLVLEFESFLKDTADDISYILTNG